MRHKDIPARAFRRAQRKRLITNIFNRKMRAENLVACNDHVDTADIMKQATSEVTTAKKCSSAECCGNPRRQRGTKRLTVLELRQDNIKDNMLDAVD